MTSHFPILLENGQKTPLFSDKLPNFVRSNSIAMRYFDLLSPLDWQAFPERGLKARWQHKNTLRYASFAAAQLLKLEEGIKSTEGLCRYLKEHPALSWLLGFQIRQSGFIPWISEFQTCLPLKRHFNRTLREMPNTALQVLLDSSVRLIQAELIEIAPDFGKLFLWIQN